MRTFVSGLLVLVATLSFAPPADAQTPHAASSAALDAALQQHADSGDAARAAIQRALEQPAVRTLAAELGVDIRRAQDAAATLEGEQLAELAARAAEVNQALAGGQSRITISTTFLIIGLLVLILLILVLK